MLFAKGLTFAKNNNVLNPQFSALITDYNHIFAHCNYKPSPPWSFFSRRAFCVFVVIFFRVKGWHP